MDPLTPFPSTDTEKTGDAQSISGEAAGVPFVAFPPSGGPRSSAPVVIAWHMMDPPRTERAFAAAVPLTGLDAWRIYLGLPLTGARLPAGGLDELMQLAAADAVLNLQQPVIYGAAEEFPVALSALREQLGLDGDAIGLMGGSSGAAVAQLVIAEGPFDIRAAVLISPLVQLRPAIEAAGRRYGVAYDWSEASQAVAERIDFVARAHQLADRGAPAVLLVVGEDDEEEFREPAAALRDELHRRADAELAVIPGMAHAFADEPGLEPAPQSPQAAAVDRAAVEWFRRGLGA